MGCTGSDIHVTNLYKYRQLNQQHFSKIKNHQYGLSVVDLAAKKASKKLIINTEYAITLSETINLNTFQVMTWYNFNKKEVGQMLSLL
jgi:hypothetical protein